MGKGDDESVDSTEAFVLGRREFLAVAVAAAALPGCSDGGAEEEPFVILPPLDIPPGPALATSPFTLGVSSGDPLDDRVILWTRLALDPLAVGGAMPAEPVPLGYEVALDEAFTEVISHGVVSAEPDRVHAVTVDATGLRPDRWYFYRFRTREHTSMTGRTRTMPRPDADPESLRIGIAACQDYRDGYYAAHAHLANEQLDLLLFLGDYIYEGDGGEIRQHASPEPTDLDGYRNRYAQYRTDPQLLAAHAACPWLVTWDDHEVENDYAGRFPQDSSEVGPAFDARRAAAYRAFFEHMPLRVPPHGPDGPFTLHRSFRFGRLAEFFMLDTRQNRTDHVCGDEEQGPPCDNLGKPEDVLLGAEQEAWLIAGLRASETRYKVLGQSVVFCDLSIMQTFFNYDQWDGYPLQRQRIVDVVVENDIDGFVVLSGDIHVAGLADLTATANDPTSQVIGFEVVSNSISSGGTGGSRESAAVSLVASSLKHVHYAHARQRGYAVADITRDGWTVHFRVVDTIESSESPVSTHKSYRLPARFRNRRDVEELTES